VTLVNRDIIAVCAEIMHKIVVIANRNIAIRTAARIQVGQLRNNGLNLCGGKRVSCAPKIADRQGKPSSILRDG
jgi:hypothetical protein